MLSSRNLKPPLTVMVLLATAGLVVALYLTVIHYQPEALNCSAANGCHKVLTSRYATVGPVPMAVLGAFYYLAIIILNLVLLRSVSTTVIKLLTLLTTVGFVTSIYLVYLQVEVIGSICPYCLSSALICTLLFITAIFIWRKFINKADRYNYKAS